MPTIYPQSEFWVYTSPDGARYDLTVPATVGRWVISNEGSGLPEIDWITQRGPSQHGATVTDFFLQPRVIQLLVRVAACSRNGYWANRAGLLNGLRPNRQLTPTGVEPGQLKFRMSTGQYRAFDCFLTQGPRFEPSQPSRWDEWAVQEVLRFTAFNPVAYDPTAHEQSFMLPEQLVFPITFPIVFGGLNDTENITYAGTWLEYPTIDLSGPMTSPRITNLATGEVIALDYDIPAGVTVTITLTYGNKTVRDSLGNNLIGTVTTDSSLATWHLAPDPEAAGGINPINVAAGSVGASASAVITYYDRYIAF